MRALQFINIENSQVQFANESKDPAKKLEAAEMDLGNLLIESAMDKAKIAELETLTGDLLIEVATLKMGGNA